MRKYAAELVALTPDVIMADGSLAVAAAQAETPSVPIVFAGVIDRVGAGYVESLARPGGNVTGFLLYEYGISGKWLELLKQIVPSVTRVVVARSIRSSCGNSPRPAGRWPRTIGSMRA